ncbi:hypothetical protein C2W62_35845, partial [Candidatus Entotheonella serta]
PTPATQRQLNNYRCVLKWTPHGVRVFTAVRAEQALIAMQPETVFTFRLWLNNPAFPSFTDMTEITAAVAPFYTNWGLPKPGVEPQELSMGCRLDRRDRRRFAEVLLTPYDVAPHVATGPQRFEVRFNARRLRWVYYVVSDRSDGIFAIGAPAAADIQFPADNPTVLTPDEIAMESVAQRLKAQYPNMTILRFVSEPMLQQQAPRRPLRLKHNSEPVKSLPNPALQRMTTIYLAGAPHPALFHVTTHFRYQPPKPNTNDGRGIPNG